MPSRPGAPGAAAAGAEGQDGIERMVARGAAAQGAEVTFAWRRRRGRLDRRESVTRRRREIPSRGTPGEDSRRPRRCGRRQACTNCICVPASSITSPFFRRHRSPTSGLPLTVGRELPSTWARRSRRAAW